MKICIIETHYHSEFLNTLIQIFKKEELHIYTIKSIYDDLPKQSLFPYFYFLQNKNKTKDFLNNILKENFDLMFVNTIQPSLVDLPKWKNFKPKCKSILTIHNLNAWYNKSIIFRKNVFHTFDSIMANIYTARILDNFDYINVVYSPLISTAQQYFPHKTIINIPYSYAQINVKTNKKKSTSFVIPGIVSNKRRDYKTVIKAFNNIFKIHKNINVVLLGKYKDNLNLSSNYKIFNDIVPRDLYDKYLRNTDFIIVPSHDKTYSVNVVSERYGYTKSPNIFEAIKWRKPLIIPNYLPIDTLLKSSLLKYNTPQQLEYILSNLIKDKSFLNKIKKEAYKNTSNFTLDNIRKKVYKELSL